MKLLERLPAAAALAGVFCVFGLTALAAPGDLDTTFAGTGVTRLGFGFAEDQGDAVALQTDGKIVVAGSGADSFALVRYNSNGSLDTSFDGDGKVVTPVDRGTSVATAVKIQNDGKIVVAGYAITNGSFGSFAVVRYNADGSLDSSFGDGGKVTTVIGTDARGNALAIQTDGKIIVAGSSKNAAKTNFAVARYNSDGSLDLSFETDGIVTTPIGTGDDVGNAVTILAGKIIVAGSSFNAGSNNGFAVVRYNSDGSLDASFDLDGIVITEIQFGTSEDVATAVAIQFGNGTILQPDTIVVAGSSSGITSDDFAVVRYNLDGSLDTSFDTDGIVRTPIGAGADTGNGLAIQGSGTNPRKIVVAGSSDDGSKTDFAVVRYNADGSLDTSFDLDGIVITPVDTNDDAGAAVTIQADGKVVVAGSSINNSSNVLDDFAVARYNSDGSLDASFDADGKRIDNVGNAVSTAKSLAIQTDGKIVVAGSGSFDFALLRLNADGLPDTSFDGDGRVTTHIGSASSVDDGKAVAIQADGKIVVAGVTLDAGTSSIAVTRYNSNGALDTSFNGTGIVTTLIGSGSGGNAVAIQGDGKIVVAGNGTGPFSDQDITVVRYNPNGSLDNSFDTDGIVTTPIAGNQVGNAVAIQTDGKIVVAGSDEGEFAVLRYNSNGSLDTSFDGDGIATTAIDTGVDGGNGVALQTDGKIVVAGFGSLGVIAVARYNSNGSLDVSFNGSGKLSDPDAGPGNAVAIQPNGKIVVAGGALNGQDEDFAVVRYNSNGARDSSYGNGGEVEVDASGGGDDEASAIALDSTGRAVVAGTSGGLFGVMRLEGGPIPTTLANISTRLRVETGDSVLIGGFIITGTQPKKILMRAIGPSLPLAGTLANPSLELFDSSGQSIAANDNWMDAPNKQEIIDSTIPPANDFESAILMSLDPGSYTAIVRGVNNTTGIALVEAYDLDNTVDSQLANISTRGLVQTGDNVMIGGFIVLGVDAQTVLVRGIGPSLPIAGSLADPMLELHDKDGAIIASNDNWRDTQEAEITATTIPPPDDEESAILQTLPPAAYTAILRGVNNTAGVALVEVYALTP